MLLILPLLVIPDISILPPTISNFQRFRLKLSYGGNIYYKINKHLLNHLLLHVLSKHLIYAPKDKSGTVVFDIIDKPANIKLFSDTMPAMSFKKILFPNGINKSNIDNQKIALIGLHACDLRALDIFYQQFSKTNILPKRENLLIIATECKPDDDCFCDIFSANKIANCDIYIQKDESDFEIFAKSPAGIKYLNKLGLKKPAKPLKIREIDIEASDIDVETLSSLINNRKLNESFWQGISNNCFGCGACTTVCPLCFCFKQEYNNNNLDGERSECLRWDSCFANDFSQIAGNFDFRPKNVDRLYNWYHHKFVRAVFELNTPLCVGCGRCARACPANLNIKKILLSLKEKQ